MHGCRLYSFLRLLITFAPISCSLFSHFAAAGFLASWSLLTLRVYLSCRLNWGSILYRPNTWRNCSDSGIKCSALSSIRTARLSSVQARDGVWLVYSVIILSVTAACFHRLSIYVLNPCSRPIWVTSHQTHCAAKNYWFFLAWEIIFSNAYTMTSLSFSKVIDIRALMFD